MRETKGRSAGAAQRPRKDTKRGNHRANIRRGGFKGTPPDAEGWVGLADITFKPISAFEAEIINKSYKLPEISFVDLYEGYMRYFKLAGVDRPAINTSDMMEGIWQMYDALKALLQKENKYADLSIIHEKITDKSYFCGILPLEVRNMTVWTLPLEFLELLKEKDRDLHRVSLPIFHGLIYDLQFTTPEDGNRLNWAMDYFQTEYDEIEYDPHEYDSGDGSGEAFQDQPRTTLANYAQGGKFGKLLDEVRRYKMDRTKQFKHHLAQVCSQSKDMQPFKDWLMQGCEILSHPDLIPIPDMEWAGEYKATEDVPPIELMDQFVVVMTTNDMYFNVFMDILNTDSQEGGSYSPYEKLVIHKNQKRKLGESQWYNDFFKWLDTGLGWISDYCDKNRKQDIWITQEN